MMASIRHCQVSFGSRNGELEILSADSCDNFPYEPAESCASAAARRHYWAVAIGLQAVDGIEVSPYLRELARGYERGARSLEETGSLIRKYHVADKGSVRGGTREADLVSQRIAELLSAAPFVLHPDMLAYVHRYLFQDLDRAVYRPGEFKIERMVKQEEILNGDSVLYADPYGYGMSLQMAFDAECSRSYGCRLEADDLRTFCHTIVFLWQVHPFYEGNTRTVAVFSELYLNHLGFSTGDEPFERHSRYYRDALVRSMYRNADADITPEDRFLVAFYDNVLNDAGHELNREDLVCETLFEHPELLRNVSPEKALKRHRVS